MSEDCKVIAVGERDGYVYNEKGLDIPALKEHFDKHGSILGFPGGESHQGDPLAVTLKQNKTNTAKQKHKKCVLFTTKTLLLFFCFFFNLKKRCWNWNVTY